MHSPVPCLPVAVIVKISNFVCLKREESAGPINCPTTRDSDVILAGVHGVEGFVGVGVLPCRPLSLSLSLAVSLSFSLSLSLSLLSLSLAVQVESRGGLGPSASPSMPGCAKLR